MNRKVPNLPSPAAADDAAPGQASVPHEDGAATTDRDPSLARPGRPPSASWEAGPPGVPAMPAMPGEALDDDDDFEIPIDIPDDVGYDEIVRTEPGGRAQPGDQSSKLLQGIVVGKRHDGVFVDIGQKSEAFLPVDPHTKSKEPLEVGGTVEVVITGQSAQGYLILGSLNTQKPQGWQQLAAAYDEGQTVIGRVTGTIKGGLTVDVGVRAFMPASRSGERTEEGLRGLVGQDVRARIVQFDEADRNVVLDRRSVLEEERAKLRQEALTKFRVGDVVTGVVRTLRRFGAFVDLGGIDGLLHVSDIAWHRVNDPSDMLGIGQELRVQILKVDQRMQRIAVGLKQLEPEPWTTVADQVQRNDRITGRVMRIKDYGAFVEVIPGVEGLVHISDMSYARRVRHPSDIVRVGEVVEVMVLDVQAHKRRIALGLKQAMGDPWHKVAKEHPEGSTVIGTVRKITGFGAFVEIMEGVDGLLHISDITSERRLSSPAEVLRVGERIRVKILQIDVARRRLKVGKKQLEPTELDMFLAEVAVGETVTGRVVKTQGGHAIVEIGNGVRGFCMISSRSGGRKRRPVARTSELSSLRSMLDSAWSKRDMEGGLQDEPLTPGSVHSFRIKRLDPDKGSIELARA